jgi:hypothetical protein
LSSGGDVPADVSTTGQANSQLGTSVSRAGDVNNDGYDDVIIGTGTNATGISAAYVVYGNSAGTPVSLPAGTIAESAGFKIGATGVGANQLGRTVSSAGDFNGDGFADLLVGAIGNSTPGNATYVVYGGSTNAGLELASGTIAASNGFKITGPSGAQLGASVSNIGDTNGDGLSDLIITSQLNSNAYVVYGNSGLTGLNVSGGTIAASNGYKITGQTSTGLGVSVSQAGDVNGDGLADVIMGSWTSSTSGSAYVVYGNTNRSALSLTDGNIAASDGFKIVGGASSSAFGRSVSGAGDVNGDGFSDVIVGAHGDVAAYVVYGSSTGATVDLSSGVINASNGFRISGQSSSQFGFAVSNAGDVNGDGLSDVIVGTNSSNASLAATYVVYGSSVAQNLSLTSGTIAASQGFRVLTTTTGTHYGSAVSNAGDINGDGLADLVVGAPITVVSATSVGAYNYILGGTQWVSTVVNGRGTVTGTGANEAIVGSAESDVLVGSGGVDRFYAGRGADTVVLSSTDISNLASNTASAEKSFVDGGNGVDTIRLTGGASFDLTTISQVAVGSGEDTSRINSIERIDMATDTAANTLTLSARDVNDMAGFNLIRTGGMSADGKTWTNVSGGTSLSDTTRFHQLVVDGSGSDVVNLKSGAGTWTNAGTVNDGTNNYVVWQNGSTSSQVIVRSGVTVNSNVAPVVLDLNRDGQIDYSRVLMDANTDGTLDSVLWAGSQDGVLVWDKYHDGQIHHFSQYAFTAFGGNTDLEGLAAGFDTNQDGIFSLKDEQFLTFKVWQDKDQDGVVDAGEMRSLGDVGIASIDLASDGVKRTPVDGVEEAGRSSATTTDGQSILVADASFEFTTANPQAMDFVNGKAPYVFSAEELAAMTPMDAQAMDSGVYSLSLGQSLDLSQLVGATHATPTALAQIDMGSDVSANVLSLSLNDVLSLPATNGVHQLKVTGAANDKLMLAEGEWTDTGAVVDQGGQRYALYTGTSDSTAQLLVDQQLLQAHQSN